MAKQEKSVIEQALLEAQEIERTFDANAKEILSRTMGSEIEEMVKESLKDSPMAINEDEDDDMEMATDLEMGDEESGDDYTVEMPEEEDGETDYTVEMPEEDEEDLDDHTAEFPG